jgi:ABC-type nitrate/sulfonate/bicarbonate transport system substrate-binding protein
VKIEGDVPMKQHRFAATVFLALLVFAASVLPSKAWGQTRISIAQAQDLLTFAPGYIARAKHFKEAGLEAQVEVLSGDGPVAAAVTSGSTQFALGSSGGMLNIAAKGEDVMAVVGVTYQTIDYIFNKEWARKKGVDKKSPLKARIEALRGSVVGGTNPGAISDTLTQYLLRWAGLNPKDAEIVSMGGIGPRLAALESNRIQAMPVSPPGGQQAEKNGYGIVLIPAADLPGFNRQIHTLLYARKSWLNANKETASRVASAVARANNFFLNSFDESLKIIESFFPKLSRDVLEPGLRAVQTQTIRNGAMQAGELAKTIELLTTIGAIKGTVDAKEGIFWTNQYNELSRVKK